jgi:predicted short-subunit dehydrogenase-like oxidoreductase (DUF2520 family)
MDNDNGITIIGTGNVAWHLSVAFKKANININKIIGRNESKVKALANSVSCSYDLEIDSIPENTDLVLLCVSDAAIITLGNLLYDFPRPVAHTAASVPLSVFQETLNRGVFYPFQTFTKDIRMGELEIPLFIEAGDKYTFKLLKTLGRAISNSVSPLNSENRKLLHIAGIMVNNFSNYFFSRAFNFLETNNIDSSKLLPLIHETVNKLDFGNPEELQTGPARRGSLDIVKEHQKLINDQELSSLYSILSESITEYYK